MAQKIKLAPRVQSFTANNGTFVITQGMVVEMPDERFEALYANYSQRFHVTNEPATHKYDGETLKTVAELPKAEKGGK